MESLIALTALALADHTIQPVKSLRIPTIRWLLVLERCVMIHICHRLQRACGRIPQ
jgi:hypothetical protein